MPPNFTSEQGRMFYRLYFIQEVKASKKAPVKIGIAKDVAERLSTLQIGNPRRLVVILESAPMSLLQARALESSLHRRFKRERIRGEWFSGKILRDVRRLVDTQSVSPSSSAASTLPSPAPTT